MKQTLVVTLLALLLSTESPCQNGKMPRYLGDPILTDSLSTLFFPTRYNEELLSTNKIAFWRDYYANVVVYDFNKDQHVKLFPTDTYIASFTHNSDYHNGSYVREKAKNITAKWVFLLVRNVDTNNNGRIDENDPSILYVVTTKGENLKAITQPTENVVSFNMFEAQGFCLIEIQRDSNNDKSFKDNDKQFYYKKIDLESLTLGNEISL